MRITIFFLLLLTYWNTALAYPEFYTTIDTGKPFILIKNNQPDGTIIHAMLQTLKALHVPNPIQHIHVVSSKNALEYIAQHKNSFLFPVIYTPMTNYQISGPIMTVQEVIIGAPSSCPLSLKQLSNYTYGLTQNDIAGIFLQSNNIPIQKIFIFKTIDDAIDAYKSHKIDYLPGLNVQLEWILSKKNIPYRIIFDLSRPFGLAMITSLKTNFLFFNTIQDIFKKYFTKSARQ